MKSLIAMALLNLFVAGAQAADCRDILTERLEWDLKFTLNELHSLKPITSIAATKLALNGGADEKSKKFFIRSLNQPGRKAYLKTYGSKTGFRPQSVIQEIVLIETRTCDDSGWVFVSRTQR